MNASDLRKMSSEELHKELDALLREQFSMRMQGGAGQLVRPHLIRNVRKDIARVKAVLVEKMAGGGNEQ